MDRDGSSTALGALLLGLILVASALLPPALATPAFAPQAGYGDLPPAGASARSTAALGWPVDPTEPDPLAWQELDGVGPVLGVRLAEAASTGLLDRPAALLQVRGIGATMAARLEPQVRWEVSP